MAYDPSSGAIHELVDDGFYAIFARRSCSASGGCSWASCSSSGAARTSSTTATCSPWATSTTPPRSCWLSGFILVFYFFIVFVLELIAPAMFLGFFIPKRLLPLLALVSPAALLLWPTDSPPLFFFRSAGSGSHRRNLVREFGAATLGSPSRSRPSSEPSSPTCSAAAEAPHGPAVLALLLRLRRHGGRRGLVGRRRRRRRAGGRVRRRHGVGRRGRRVLEGGSSAYAALSAALAVFPFAIRLVQSLKKVLPSGDGREDLSATKRSERAKNAANALKYTASLALIAVSLSRGPRRRSGWRSASSARA